MMSRCQRNGMPIRVRPNVKRSTLSGNDWQTTATRGILSITISSLAGAQNVPATAQLP